MKKFLSFALTLALGIGLGLGGMSLAARAAGVSKTAEPTNDAIYVNGKKMDLEVYKIDGSNYFKLRDLGKALDFYVGWSQERGVYIESGRPYVEEGAETPSTSAPAASTGNALTDEVIRLVNVERAKEGLAPLGIYDSLTAAAQTRAGEVATTFSHTRPDGSSCFTALDETGAKEGAYAWGENIAAGNSTAAETMEQWMNSPGHRANILNPDFTHIGVGYAAGGAYRYNWVQIFVGRSSAPVSASSASNPSADLFAELDGKSFTFASGAGAWSTELTFGPGGTFTGNFHDSDMGDTGNAYPNGTLYFCGFSGSFSGAEQVDDFTWSIHLGDVSLSETPEETEIIDGVRYIYAEPYGLDNGDLFYVYLPGRPTADLPEQYINWISPPLGWGRNNTPAALPFWGLYNVGGEMGFYSPETA